MWRAEFPNQPNRVVGALGPVHRTRSKIVQGVVIAGLVAVGLQLIFLYAFPDEKFRKNEGYHEGLLPLSAPRGRIYDREMRVLARDRLAPSIWANPREVEDPHRVAQRISTRLGLDENVVLDLLTRRGENGKLAQDVPIKRWLSESEFEALGDLGQFVGVRLLEKREPVRFYPEGELASHVLGFVSRDGSQSQGIERLYYDRLKSDAGWVKARVDGRRNPLFSQTLDAENPRAGDDIILTLDKTIQYVLERELRAGLERAGADHAMGVIMDPHTGAILALACLPSFDPNAYSEYPAELRRNRAVTDVFEPGSAFKIVIASAALELGLLTPSTVVDCEGGSWKTTTGRRIRDVHKMGKVPFQEAFAESSNVATVKVAQALVSRFGREALDEWIRRFGFGERTSRDLDGESQGIYRPVKDWSALSPVSLAIGQEIGVTMPQLARAFCAIANGGWLVEPYLVERAVAEDGMETYRHEADRSRRVMSEETARTMREMCYEVVAHGTGQTAKIHEYRAGGKTGTAQVARAEGGGYYPDRYTAVFAGFAPVSNPRVCAVIVVHDPRGSSYYGGKVCGPIFREVVKETLGLLECPYEWMTEEERGSDDSGSEDADVLVAARPEAPAPPAAQIEGTGAAAGGPMQLASGAADQYDEGPRFPDLTGMTKRQVHERLAAMGLEWDAQGIGWVVAQDPPAGTPLTDVRHCRLVFSNDRSTTAPYTSSAAAPASM